MRQQPEWAGCDPVCADVDLEQVLDGIADEQLMTRIAAVIANTRAGHPQAVMRTWRVFIARLEGKTLEQIAAAEGRSRERIRQILSDVRATLTKQPGLFDGYDRLEHATRCQVGNYRHVSRLWRLGYTNDLPETVDLAQEVRR